MAGPGVEMQVLTALIKISFNGKETSFHSVCWTEIFLNIIKTPIDILGMQIQSLKIM